MTEEQLKDYYADRPTEPYSDDDSPNDWANIAHYAEENLEKAFKRIAELEVENEALKSANRSMVKELDDKYSLGLDIVKNMATLKTQIIDAKKILIKVCKFLHNTGNIRQDKSAYEERDKILKKLLKFDEKWGDLK